MKNFLLKKDIFHLFKPGFEKTVDNLNESFNVICLT